MTNVTASIAATVARPSANIAAVVGAVASIAATAPRPSASLTFVSAVATINARFAARPSVPLMHPREMDHRRQIAGGVNRAIKGQIDCTFPLTLAANAAQTAIADARISSWTAALFMPTTPHAAAEMAAGTLHSNCTNGLLIVNHANNAQNDRTFQVAIIG